MKRVLLIVAMIQMTLVTVAHASDDERAATFAVQNRKFKLGHELNVEVGVLPLNAFTKGITIGGGYTYHFTDVLAWEVAQFYYSFGADTDLKKTLQENFNPMVQPTTFETVNYFGSSNLVIKPMYGKYSLFNRWVVHSEFFLALGPAFAKYNDPAVFRGGFDAGIGFRLHLVQHVSIRLDLRDYTFFQGATPKSELYIALGIAVSFGGRGK